MDVELEPVELEPAEIPPGELRQLKEDANEWLRQEVANGWRSRPSMRAKLIAHILWIEDELERVMEQRDSVRDRHANEVEAGRTVGKSLRDQIVSLRNELHSVQEDGTRLLIAVEQIRMEVMEGVWTTAASAEARVRQILLSNGFMRP